MPPAALDRVRHDHTVCKNLAEGGEVGENGVGLDDDDLVNNNRSRPLLPDRPVRPVGARQPLNVRPNSPEGRIPYEGATGHEKIQKVRNRA